MPDLWIDVDANLSEVPVNKSALIDDTDFKSREESVTYNQSGLDLLWNFVTTAGAFTQTAVTPTDTGGNYDWVNQGNGMYSIEIPATGGASINNDTEGFGWFSGFATGILPWIGPVIGFRAAALNNALIDGGDVLDVSLTEMGGAAQSATDLKDFADTGYDPSTHKVADVTTLSPISNLDAAITSRASDTDMGTVGATVAKLELAMSDLGGGLDYAVKAVSDGEFSLALASTLVPISNLDAAVTSRMASNSAISNLDAAVSSRMASNSAISNLDAAVSTRAPASTALSSAVWTGTKAGYLDAAVSGAVAPTVEEIDTQLSGTHGAGAWGSGGAGVNTVAIVTATSAGVRIPSVNIEVYTLGGVLTASCVTDSNGDATINIDDGTYNFIGAKDQYNMNTTASWVVPTSGLTVTVTGSAVAATVSTTPTTTVLDIIKRALRLLTVSATNEAPDSPEAADAFSVLNAMINQWNNEKLSLYAVKTEFFSVASGSGAYTIGSGGTWDTTRPLKIEKIFLRDSASGSNLDYPIELINNDQYQDIFFKSLQTPYPKYAFYQPNYPLGTISFWPVPTKTFSACVCQWGVLSAFTSTTQTVTLPPGYEMALGYALAYHIAPEYGIDPKKYEKQMIEAKDNIGKVNTDMLLMKNDAFTSPNSGGYNIYNG